MGTAWPLSAPQKKANGERILIALGGNAIKQAKEEGTSEEQFRNCHLTSKHIVQILKQLGESDRLVVTHGNGPQAGNLLVQQDAGKGIVPAQTMDIVGAMTQGQIGYMLQQTLQNYLIDEGMNIPVLAVVNQVLVDKNDPEFSGDTASKPVGNFLSEEEALVLKRDHPEYIVKKVKPIGERVWRRTVASPDPIRNVESEALRKLVDLGFLIIASGGGGIPVILGGRQHYQGVEAVIDKDLAGERLAETVGATVFMVLTDVEKVKLNFGKKDEREIEKMHVSEARKYLEEGQFLPGSMKPKVMACVRFLEWGGRKAIITSLDKAAEAFQGNTGTVILP